MAPEGPLSSAIADDGADGFNAAKRLGDGLDIADFSVPLLPTTQKTHAESTSNAQSFLPVDLTRDEHETTA